MDRKETLIIKVIKSLMNTADIQVIKGVIDIIGNTVIKTSWTPGTSLSS
jgi:hypothetical protein